MDLAYGVCMGGWTWFKVFVVGGWTWFKVFVVGEWTWFKVSVVGEWTWFNFKAEKLPSPPNPHLHIYTVLSGTEIPSLKAEFTLNTDSPHFESRIFSL